MREESGSEEDSDEPVEWEGDDEASSEEDGSEDEVRVSNAQLRPARSRAVSLGEKGWARRAVVVKVGKGARPFGVVCHTKVKPYFGIRQNGIR